MPRPYRRKSSSRKQVEHDPNTQRINKVLAAAGLGSRRDVEELIVQGRVEVDGQTVTNLATRVDPRVSKIEVDGVQLKRSQLVYYALNKPKGVLSTNSDPSGRARVIDYVPDRHRVFSVGRLDRHSEGLMLLTNDGDLAQRLAHPRFRVQKTYFVVVAGLLTNEELAKLKKGVYLAEGVARIDGARIRKTRKTCTELEILLSEGKNREIRRILARAGHKVVLLRRIAIGPLRLAELPVGAVRELTSNEVKALYACTEQSQTTSKTAGVKTAGAKTAGAKSAKAKRSAAAEAEATETQAVAFDKIVTPLDSTDFDDFGLGLEQNYQYDESALTPSDDAIEFGASEEEEWDDDFVSDFESLSSGSVLGYDDDEVAPGSGDTSSGHERTGKGPKGFKGKSQSAGKRSAGGKKGLARSARTTSDRGGGSRTKGSRGDRTRAGADSAESFAAEAPRPATRKTAGRPRANFGSRAEGPPSGRAAGKPRGKPSGKPGKHRGKPGGKPGSKPGGKRKPRD